MDETDHESDINIMKEKESCRSHLLNTLSRLSSFRLESNQSGPEIIEFLKSLNSIFQDLFDQTKRNNKQIPKGLIKDVVQGWEWCFELSFSVLDVANQDEEKDADKLTGWRKELIDQLELVLGFLLLESFDLSPSDGKEMEKKEKRWSDRKKQDGLDCSCVSFLYWDLLAVIGKWIVSFLSLELESNGQKKTNLMEIDHQYIALFMKVVHRTGFSAPTCFQLDLEPSLIGLFTSFYGHSRGYSFFPWGVIEKQRCFMNSSCFMLLDDYTQEKSFQISHQLEFLQQLLCGLKSGCIDLIIPNQNSPLDNENHNEEFIGRLCRLVVTAPTQSLSQQSYRLLARIEETISKKKCLELIGFLFALSVPSLCALGIEFMKKGMKREYEEIEAGVNQKESPPSLIFTAKRTVDDIICLIVFNPTSPLYTTQQKENKKKNVLDDSLVLLDKLDIIMQALNFYRFLQMKEKEHKSTNYDIFSEDTQDSIRSLFWIPMKKAVDDTTNSLQDETSFLRKQLILNRGPIFLNLVPLQLQLLYDQLERV